MTELYEVITPSASIGTLKGVGKKTEEKLNSIGIHTVNDVVFYLPNSYVDQNPTDVNSVKLEEVITVSGVVKTEPTVTYLRKGLNRMSFHMETNNVYIKVTFFNQAYLKKQIEVGDTINVHGKFNKPKQEMSGRSIIKPNGDTMDMRYALNKVMNNKTFGNIVKEVFRTHIFNQDLPEYLIKKYKLMPIKQTLYHLHFPDNMDELQNARRTMKFYELFMFQVKIIEKRKQERVPQKESIVKYDVEKLKLFIGTLPFELTKDQKTSVNDICRDLLSEFNMHRLLQGDVGSGKTIVAGISVYALKTAHKQSAIMVPTEVLANQHYESLVESFNDELTIELLTGTTTPSEKRRIKEALKNGDIDLIIGTHALFEDDVVFKDLGLVIIDEQHRFGVNQREKLIKKAKSRNVLYMTATPIPRTLSITAFGDMDVSLIKTMPAGRLPIKTFWKKEKEIDEVLAFIKKEMDAGRNIYVVAPLIEESEVLDLMTTEEVYHMFRETFGEDKVELVHGRMKPEEKAKAMARFESLETPILVSTTVIEVGINVKNATVMTIFNAERFGLSTLHQLRGRVGRNDLQSYCILISEGKTEQAQMRMNIMTETTDGFVLSERDLEMRGPGDFFGVRQSGLPEFKVADLVHDYRILEVARSEAIKLFKEQ